MKQNTGLCAAAPRYSAVMFRSAQACRHAEGKGQDRQLLHSLLFNYFDILAAPMRTGLTVATSSVENAFEIEETGVRKGGIYRNRDRKQKVKE